MNHKSIIQQRGFTLIELIAVFSITAILSSLSVASYVTYNNYQTFTTAVENIESLLNSAKSQSISSVIPTQCPGLPLSGYQVAFTPPSNYELDVLCDGGVHSLTKSVLPANITISSVTSPALIFMPLTGQVQNQETITIVGYGHSQQITVNANGVISVSDRLSPVDIRIALDVPSSFSYLTQKYLLTCLSDDQENSENCFKKVFSLQSKNTFLLEDKNV